MDVTLDSNTNSRNRIGKQKNRDCLAFEVEHGDSENDDLFQDTGIRCETASALTDSNLTRSMFHIAKSKSKVTYVPLDKAWKDFLTSYPSST